MGGAFAFAPPARWWRRRASCVNRAPTSFTRRRRRRAGQSARRFERSPTGAPRRLPAGAAWPARSAGGQGTGCRPFDGADADPPAREPVRDADDAAAALGDRAAPARRHGARTGTSAGQTRGHVADKASVLTHRPRSTRSTRRRRADSAVVPSSSDDADGRRPAARPPGGKAPQQFVAMSATDRAASAGGATADKGCEREHEFRRGPERVELRGPDLSPSGR